MKNNKILKNLIIVLLIILSLFTITGCDLFNTNDETKEEDNPIVINDVDQDNIDYCIDMISEIGTVTLKSKSDIEFAKELYESLNEKEKALVTNYNVLQSAINTLNYLENEDEYILEGYEVLKKYLDETIPSYVNKETLDLNFITKYEYKTDYNQYIFQLAWVTTDYKYIGQTGGVYHSYDEQTITVSCEISCLKIKETAAFSKEVTIEPLEKENKDTPMVVSYFYGNYNGFTDVDKSTIDVVNYAFAQIASKTVSGKTEYYIEVSNGDTITEMVDDLHKYGIKVCLSLGGWHDDSTFWDTYSDAAATDAARKQVANACLETMIKYNLDGIDMDWEYPSSSERANFTALMKEISVTLKAKDSSYLITGAFPGGEWTNRIYDFASLNEFMDYFYIMTYDMDFDGSTVTKHMCDVSTTKTLAQAMIKIGCDASKVVIGIAFYGRLFYGVGSTNNGYGQTFTSRSAINYSKTKEYLDRVGNGVVKIYDKTHESYYLYDKTNKEWISYDGEETITAKYNYTVSNGLGGVMFWCYQNDSTGDLMTFIQNARNAAKEN